VGGSGHTTLEEKGEKEQWDIAEEFFHHMY